MILQFGVRSQFDNLVALIATQGLGPVRSITTLGQVQAQYRKFLAHLQKRKPGGRPGTAAFVTEFEAALRLRQLFVNDSLLDDEAQAGVIADVKDPDAARKRNLMTRALDELRLYSEDHRALFDTVITDVFILPSSVAKAGSTSQAMGVIWANPRINYPLHDVMEMLVHELTHHAMFIDEIRFSHYNYGSVPDQNTWARSAILNVPRPLDKVLHSAVVATEILLLRERVLGHPVRPAVHPPTPFMLCRLQDALRDMEERLREADGHQAIFRDRAWEILESVKRHAAQLNARHRASPISIAPIRTRSAKRWTCSARAG